MQIRQHHKIDSVGGQMQKLLEVHTEHLHIEPGARIDHHYSVVFFNDKVGIHQGKTISNGVDLARLRGKTRRLCLRLLRPVCENVVHRDPPAFQKTSVLFILPPEVNIGWYFLYIWSRTIMVFLSRIKT
jgi:hypothetical protein